MKERLRCLRPCLITGSGPLARYLHPAYDRPCLAASFSNLARTNTESKWPPRNPEVMEQCETHAHVYPRLTPHGRRLTCRTFNERFQALEKSETLHESSEVSLQGRVNSIRAAGSKLVFLDLLQEGHHVQSLCKFNVLAETGVTLGEFRRFHRGLRRGDILSIRGVPHRTIRGELSLMLRELPCLLSPCLHRLPTTLQDHETRIRNRHVDFLVNPDTAHIIRLRAEIIRFMRQFLSSNDYLEVQTPILAASAGGAVARSFETAATEFPDKALSLRIAPELWLKRFVIGGFDRVFEIGPSFRNEGLDLNHNPEFTTCEFYRAYIDLEDLIKITEDMLGGLADHVSSITFKQQQLTAKASLPMKGPFRRIDFIPGLEAALSQQLPNLLSPDVEVKIREILIARFIPLPSSSSLPQMLDRLSAVFLEPQCKNPTFIINHPECLSPLSKSFVHSTTGQRVAARAELFVDSQEIANMYEEENSPFEQRRKFLEQSSYKPGLNEPDIDESYLDALEWGLPPTGGWGCGIDRLCMLMSGAKRIGDVLSFGTLRNVVAQRKGYS